MTPATQTYTSANTSVNSKRLPAIYKKINWDKIKTHYGNLQKHTNYQQEKGYKGRKEYIHLL